MAKTTWQRLRYSGIMIRRVLLVSFVLSVVVLASHGEKPPPPPGVIATSVGEFVVLADPEGRWSKQFETGTVGWLYPAPAGVGRTTVLDLHGPVVTGQLDGVTMPHFGPEPDRYVVVLGEVLTLSYPDRAIVNRFDAGIDHPWQVIVISNTAVLVLDRRPDGEDGSVLVAADPSSDQVVYRRPLPGDVRRMALSFELGLLAFADASSSRVRLVEPVGLATVAEFEMSAPVVDVAFLNDGQSLVAVAGAPDGKGVLHLWRLKRKKTELKLTREAVVELGATPVRMAAWPAGPRVAVGLESARIEVVDLKSKNAHVVHSVELPGVPRDLVWCDPNRPGPSLPDWSDDDPPEFVVGRPPS
jgi:hypothetical protein